MEGSKQFQLHMRRMQKLHRKRMQKQAEMMKKRQEEILKYERRVLMEVPVIPEPIVVTGPVLHAASAPTEQQQSPCHSPTPADAPPEAAPQTAEEILHADIAEEFQELNSSNAEKFATEHSDLLLGSSPTQWHQITIKTPVQGSKRKFVILAINKQITPLKLIPYFFRMENNHITFEVNLCGLALKALCRKGLKVPYISDKFIEIEMTVKLFTKNFDLPETLKEIVSTRLDSRNKFLDLSYINSIPEVRRMLFDPSDNWHILDQMLRIAESMAPKLTTLGLAGNGIPTLNPFWDFLAHSKWQSLRTLDLADNQIQNTGTLSNSRTFQITELYMDRNPICKIDNRGPYINVIRAIFPHLTKLDGTYIHTTPRLPLWKPNFIVGSADDSGEFADQFIEHFFTLYDGDDRMKLSGLYHKNACFSMSCLRLDTQTTTCYSRLTDYMADTRNLLRCSDMKKARATLTQGSENILKRLSNLPKTQHDPYSFSVDLTLRTLTTTVLTVTGIFRDIVEEERSCRHFSRTFVLMGLGNCTYEITNDILYITNTTTREEEEAFKFERPPKMKLYQSVLNFSEFEKNSMTRLVQQLTCMTTPWSRKCLEDTDWDLKEALEIFVELYEARKIPQYAFLRWK